MGALVPEPATIVENMRGYGCETDHSRDLIHWIDFTRSTDLSARGDPGSSFHGKRGDRCLRKIFFLWGFFGGVVRLETWFALIILLVYSLQYISGKQINETGGCKMKDAVAMKIYITGICSVLLVCLSWGEAGARDPHSEHGAHRPAWSRQCSTLEDLDLSEDQLAAIDAVNSRYKDPIMETYHGGMQQKIEIRSLLRNSDADEQSIMEKFRAYVKMREQLFDQMMQYQIHIRAILTPDQQRSWCTLMGSPDFHGGW